MEGVKKHFEEEAQEFDTTILKLVPYYPQMIQALVSAIPFKESEKINIIDLGCGTGYISMKLKERFPNSKLTCLDFAENMITQARIRLKKYDSIIFYNEDFRKFEFDKTYDVAVSSLALHHLETKKEKKKFYSKIFDSLKSRGVFYNADIILSSNDYLQKLYISKWKEFMSRTISTKEIEDTWMTKHHKEDHPEILLDQLEWLKEIGFTDVDVVWKYYNFSVYGGTKPK
ncbi:MAG TPA: methyltransferase domain-containing protein [Methanofastidiosum sp.]|nr:methyltransferase domain-containing protein [Methanofastidiosum sp.]HQK63182.1 methyltransferase domain-containing protein [Methanofastidiosum sp.]HQQ48984.1 methyltransferase domain-containing protein [Methanofastidiosum sp.]